MSTWLWIVVVLLVLRAIEVLVNALYAECLVHLVLGRIAYQQERIRKAHEDTRR